MARQQGHLTAFSFAFSGVARTYLWGCNSMSCMAGINSLPSFNMKRVTCSIIEDQLVGILEPVPVPRRSEAP